MRAAEKRDGGSRTVLILRALGLGDFLTGVPAYRALRTAFPEHRIVLAAPRVLEPLLPMTGALDALVPVGELEPVPWPEEPPDLAVDLHGKGAASHRLLAALGPRRLIAFADPGGGFPQGPIWRQDEHEVDRWCRLLRESGIPADPRDLMLRRNAVLATAPASQETTTPDPQDAPDGSTRRQAVAESTVIVHPGAAFASRRWPPERFAAVARTLTADGRRVLITAGPNEAALGALVARYAGLTERSVRRPADLADLVSLVATARLVVCGDTGVAHVATALGTASVVLFGPVPPSEWGPPASGAGFEHHKSHENVADPPACAIKHLALWRAKPGYRGDPHGATLDPALDALGVDEVLSGARQLLARRPA